MSKTEKEQIDDLEALQSKEPDKKKRQEYSRQITELREKIKRQAIMKGRKR